MGLDSLSEEDIYDELKQHIYGVKPESQINFNNSFKYKHYISHIDLAQKDHTMVRKNMALCKKRPLCKKNEPRQFIKIF